MGGKESKMITVIAAVIENTTFSIVFKNLKYQFMVNEEVLFEDTDYAKVRAEWGEATKY